MENLLISSHEVISSINSSSLTGQSSTGSHANGTSIDNIHDITFLAGNERQNTIPSPNSSPRPSPRFSIKHPDFSKDNVDLFFSSQKESNNFTQLDEQQNLVSI